jgi:hypothetical protein
MTLTSWAVLLYIPFVLASSLPVLPTFDDTSIPALDVNDSPSSTVTRTVWDIIWIRAKTLIACTWTAIHPNILGKDEGKFPSPIYHGNHWLWSSGNSSSSGPHCSFFSARKATRCFDDAFGAQFAQVNGDHQSMKNSYFT